MHVHMQLHAFYNVLPASTDGVLCNIAICLSLVPNVYTVLSITFLFFRLMSGTLFTLYKYQGYPNKVTDF